jgi:hypothetical protein
MVREGSCRRLYGAAVFQPLSVSHKNHVHPSASSFIMGLIPYGTSVCRFVSLGAGDLSIKPSHRSSKQEPGLPLTLQPYAKRLKANREEFKEKKQTF